MRNVFLAVVVVHSVLVVGLAWPHWQVVFAALAGWGLAAVGAQEPRLRRRAARHRDVEEAERSELGRALLFREGWIPRSTWRCAVGLVVVSAAGLGALASVGPANWTPGHWSRCAAWLPLGLLAGGTLCASVINVWSVTGPLLALWLLALIGFAVDGEALRAARVGVGGLAPVAALFAIDMLRGVRRGVARRRAIDARRADEA